MKCNVINLLGQVAADMAHRRTDPDPVRAYVLYELANNLRELMRGEATLEEWNKVYVGANMEPFDIDKLLPNPRCQCTNDE